MILTNFTLDALDLMISTFESILGNLLCLIADSRDLECTTNAILCSLPESVREDLKFLKSHPLVRQELRDTAVGYVYDIKTGMLNPVSI